MKLRVDRLPGVVAAVLLLIAAPDLPAQDITQIDADGLAGELESMKGRVVLVNFWATWCRPCLEEIPDLMKLESELDEQGFELVAVSLDELSTLETTVLPFMEKWFPDFSSHISVEREMDAMVSVIDPAWNEVLPTSYVIGRNGSVLSRSQGGNSADEFRAMILPAL